MFRPNEPLQCPARDERVPDAGDESATYHRGAAARAVELVMPMLRAAVADGRIGDSQCLHVVVMHPLKTPGNATFEEAVLYEASVGDRDRWDADYAAYARGKAALSWRTGQNSHAVCTTVAHLLRPEDTALWGSVWHEGIIVGVSGAQPWYDEAFAGAVAHAFKAVLKDYRLRAAADPVAAPG
ncbi:Uncharacterised protein [Bordetella ansorpii]|uniref:Uncharacterized protein n=1 Tax=Bordetella ansorpii TaxID=288768 RepID=A0A157MCR9_9BORD|nr:hypothetical protein [Bordetella ansorpii]SAI06912.1 Uncharacterised protein [Bordetella ansorpii]